MMNFADDSGTDSSHAFNNLKLRLHVNTTISDEFCTCAW